MSILVEPIEQQGQLDSEVLLRELVRHNQLSQEEVFHQAWCRLEAIEEVRVRVEQLVQLGNRTYIHCLLLLPFELLLLNLQLVDN